ncbi:MAG: resolvase [Thaumarchaeota archaeon]|nr:resolvase [Nitrososphaerota archaeon]
MNLLISFSVNTTIGVNIMGNISRWRGYSFEHTLVKRMNSSHTWYARRFGGSSTGFPDIVAVNNNERTLLTVEAKTGTSNNLYVPPDQIERCAKILDVFGLYEKKYVILAFKFMSKRRVRSKGNSGYQYRQIHEYYKVANRLLVKKIIPTVKCTYDGRTFVIVNEVAKPIQLDDYVMPFQQTMQKVVIHQRA